MTGQMEESLVRWTLNGKPCPPFLCSPGDTEDMLRGHMAASGLAADPLSVRIREGAAGVWEVACDVREDAGLFMVDRLEKLAPLASGLTVSLEEVRRAVGEVMDLDHGGGLHAVLLWDGKRTALGRDIGRHNAVEKAVGRALREGMRPEACVMCSSARLSLEMMGKAAFCGIPVVATRKQIGTLCVQWAGRLQMALCRPVEEPVCFGAAWRIRGME